MKYIGILMTVLFLSLQSANAQEYKYFKVEKYTNGTYYLEPLSNKDLYHGIAQTPVYINRENIDEYTMRLINILTSVIPKEIWDKIDEDDRKDISFMTAFDKTGKVFKMDVNISENIFTLTTEEQWNEVCNQFKSVNIIPYLKIDEKEHFVYSIMVLRPFRAFYRIQEKKNRLRP